MSGQAFLDRLKSQVRRQDHRRQPAGHRSLDRSHARGPGRGLPVPARRARPAVRHAQLHHGVDYSSPTRRRPPRPTSQPHLEVVYHLSSFTQKHTPRAQGDAAALEGRQAGRAARSAHRSAASGAPPTGTSARSTTCAACASPAIPTCGASCAPKTGSAIRCARTTSCRWNTTASEDVRRSNVCITRFTNTTVMATQLDDPAHHRVRRPHRRDARQHGAAAPQHARRAAAGAADRRRGRLRGHAAPRLPAPLRREDRRERHAAPVHPLHRPDGLPGRDEHEPRLLAGRREAAAA